MTWLELDENRLVSYTIVEIKARKRDAERVTKAEEFDKAHRLLTRVIFRWLRNYITLIVNTSIIELDWKSI